MAAGAQLPALHGCLHGMFISRLLAFSFVLLAGSVEHVRVNALRNTFLVRHRFYTNFDTKGKFSEDASSAESRALEHNPMELAIRVLLRAVARDVVNDFALRPLLAKTEETASTGITKSNISAVPKSEGFITVNSPVAGAPTVTLKLQEVAKNGLRWAMFRWKMKRRKK